jgi:hypothetical protein
LLHEAYSLLVSPKLAIGLLVVVLACCVVGVTFVRGARAGQLIFATLWFNGLLVLLAVSSASAFFSRVWKRKLTLLSAGMILFHLSFAAMLGGIVYNRLFFFDGLLRVTEGETVPNGALESYDRIDQGRFFDLSELRGETTLVKMHVNYKVDGENKRAAYEVALSDGDALVRQIMYVTQHLDFEGIRFFCQKEGYSVLLVASDGQGREIYGAHVPLQSLRQPDRKFLYAAGTAEGIAPFPFPPPPEHPLAEVQMSYRPSTVAEREGEVTFQVLSLESAGAPAAEREGRTVVGGRFDAGKFTLEPREIRYWVGINVRHDPGYFVILASLCLGATGMTLTFVARLRQGAARRRSA